MVWVWTNGVFDCLHCGHLATLEWAKAQGDVLVVGVNSDASVRRLKGDGRPIIPLDQRIRLVAALRCVDFTIAFEEDTPYRILCALKPDVIVKGDEYRNLPVVGSDLAEVRYAPTIPGLSTTNLIQKTGLATR